jgi:hypothetical protein
MACSLPAGLRTKAVACATLVTAALLASVALHAQDANRYILATRRSGAIEIIDPESLATLGRIHFDLPSSSSGLNGVSASADGTMLYVEGPIPNEPQFKDFVGGCCVLYSIDLATLQTRQVADIPGTASRAAFVTSDGITYQAAALGGAAEIKEMVRWNDMHVSPNGGPIFGVTHFPGGALDIYDRAQGKILHYLVPSDLGKRWWPNGLWMDDRFLFYAAKDDGSDARLWSVSPGATELGEGVPVQPFAKVSGCSSYVEAGLAAASGNLFLYETFGWKLDRRNYCSGVPGGVWLLDPSSGSLLAHVATEFYFSELVTDRENGELYGISLRDPTWGRGIELVRMDARDGTILQSRVLESDYWRIAFAPLRTVATADVRALISARK